MPKTDNKKRELIEAKNIADSMIYNTEKTLKENGDKVSDDIKTEVNQKLEELKKVKDGDSMDEIKKNTDALSEAIQKIGSQIYGQQQQTPPQGQAGESGPEGASEAETEEKK